MRHFLIALPIALTVSACGGGSGSVGGNPDGGGGASDLAAGPDLAVSPDVACADTVAALCKRLSDCAPALVTLQYGDVATCNKRLSINCQAVFSLPGTSASPGRSDLCAAAFASATCDDLTRNKLPADCVPRPGTLQNGAACADDAQCASAACVHPVGDGCGTCGTQPGAGESCAKLACAGGLVCGPDTAVCASYGKLNDACDPNHPCLPSLSCKGSNKKGTCITPLPRGTACDPLAAEYAGCDLARGEYCAPGPKTCQPIKFAAAGGACGLVNNEFVVCSSSGHCTATNLFIPGSCLKAAADGAACDPTKGPDCMPPARCMGGLCKIVDPTSCR